MKLKHLNNILNIWNHLMTLILICCKKSQVNICKKTKESNQRIYVDWCITITQGSYDN